MNQGAEVASGKADTATGLRLVANDAIPYLVSSSGYLRPALVMRRRRRIPPGAGRDIHLVNEGESVTTVGA